LFISISLLLYLFAILTAFTFAIYDYMQGILKDAYNGIQSDILLSYTKMYLIDALSRPGRLINC